MLLFLPFLFSIVLFLASIFLIFIFHTVVWFYPALLVVTIILLICFHKKEDIIGYILAALLGGIGEAVMVMSGVWKYSDTTFGGMPLYVPLFWGISFVCIKKMFEMLYRYHGLPHLLHFDNKQSIFSWKNLLIGLISYPITLVLVIFFQKDNIVISIILSILFFIHLRIFYKKHDIILLLFAGFIGPFVEVFGTSLKLWHYSHSNFFNLPIWLPILYAFFFFAIRNASAFSIHLFDLFHKDQRGTN